MHPSEYKNSVVDWYIERTIHSMRVARTIVTSPNYELTFRRDVFSLTRDIAEDSASKVASFVAGEDDLGKFTSLEESLNLFELESRGITPSNRKGKKLGESRDHIRHKLDGLKNSPRHHLYYRFMDRRRHDHGLDGYMNPNTLIIAPYSTDYFLLECYRNFVGKYIQDNTLSYFQSLPVILSEDLKMAVFPQTMPLALGLLGVYVNSDGTGQTLNAAVRETAKVYGVDQDSILMCNRRVASDGIV